MPWHQYLQMQQAFSSEYWRTQHPSTTSTRVDKKLSYLKLEPRGQRRGEDSAQQPGRRQICVRRGRMRGKTVGMLPDVRLGEERGAVRDRAHRQA
eukprot:2827135-Rhodomonas_salina.5